MSIDLYTDFNEELDARAGDYDDGDNPERNSDGEGIGNDEDGDQNKEKVEPKLKIVKIKRKNLTLNVEKLKGDRGIIAIDDFYKNMKFRGKGYEKQDLDDVMKRLEHWAHRMFPKYNFDDSLAAIERLGKKKEMNIHMVRYRMDQLTKDDERNLLDVPEDLEEMHVTRDEPADEFDALIDEQIALTTAHSRMHATNVSDRSFDNISGIASQYNNSISSTPAPQTFTSITQPLSSPQTSQISEETRARIAENRLRALAIFEQKKKEAEIKQQQEKMEIEKSADTPKNISIYIDDDDF